MLMTPTTSTPGRHLPVDGWGAASTLSAASGSRQQGPSARQLREASKDLMCLLCINNDLSYEVREASRARVVVVGCRPHSHPPLPAFR